MKPEELNIGPKSGIIPDPISLVKPKNSWRS